jgi:hypothetical protein
VKRLNVLHQDRRVNYALAHNPTIRQKVIILRNHEPQTREDVVEQENGQDYLDESLCAWSQIKRFRYLLQVLRVSFF